MKKKRAFTLLEIMIVIFLIGIIGSVIGYNMRGSLEEGKAFKTKQAQSTVRDILELEMAKGSEIDLEDRNKICDILKASGLVKNPKKFLKDGWGHDLEISISDDGEIQVISTALNRYLEKKKAVREYDSQEDEDE